MIGDALFKWAIAGRLPVSPFAGVLVLGLLVPASAAVSPLALMTLTTLVIMAVAAEEARTRRHRPEAHLEAEAEGDQTARKQATR